MEHCYIFMFYGCFRVEHDRDVLLHQNARERTTFSVF